MFRSALYKHSIGVLEGITIIEYLKHTHYYREVFLLSLHLKKVVLYST